VRIAYFDCFSGISGDMALAALVDAGADLDAISDALGSLLLEPFKLSREDIEVHGISATRIQVHAEARGLIRTYASIRAALDQAKLPNQARLAAHRIFRRLAEASAKVHAKDVDFVTFHEFGELDCVVDVVGSALALKQLEVERVFASAIPTGMGMARTEHGAMPIPSALVVELLQGVPIYSRGIPVELATPTGAAILAALAEGYGDRPVMRSDRVGYGAGEPRRDFPNVLRVEIGEEERAGREATQPIPLHPESVLIEAEEGLLIEAILERPEEAAPLLERLGRGGALEAWASTASRPGGLQISLVSALASVDDRAAVLEALRETPGVTSIRLSAVEILAGQRESGVGPSD
jgi:pyridinium-3,5-bisthiocarboxylic acid mononucleotide nickel chelatase